MEEIKRKRGRPTKGGNEKQSDMEAVAPEQKLLETTTQPVATTDFVPTQDESTDGEKNLFANSPPSDIFSDEMPKEEIRPLDGKVDEKSYANIPDETPHPSNKQDASKEFVPSPPEAMPDKVNVPESTTSPEEIKNKAEQTAEAIIDGYETIFTLGGHIAKVNMNVINELHLKNTIDLNERFEFGGKEVNSTELFTTFNSTIDENTIVSEEFKDKARPPLKRLLEKHNVLMSDGMYLLQLTARDAVPKLSVLWGLHTAINNTLNTLKEMQAEKLKKETQQSGTTQINDKSKRGDNGGFIQQTEDALEGGREWSEKS